MIPTLRRNSSYLSATEFANLIGRTGRPGVATEGRSLVYVAAFHFLMIGAHAKLGENYNEINR